MQNKYRNIQKIFSKTKYSNTKKIFIYLPRTALLLSCMPVTWWKSERGSEWETERESKTEQASEQASKRERARMGKRASEGEKTVEHFEFRIEKTCIYTLFTEKEEGG